MTATPNAGVGSTSGILTIPDEIESVMCQGGSLFVSISGGKDSQAMINILSAEYRRREWPGEIKALHMDLGRAEWPQTPAFVRHIAEVADLELIVVRRPQGDLVQEIQDRMDKLAGTDRPFWPSSAARYCTADQKRGQADKVYRKAAAPFWPSAAARYCTSHQKTNQADKVYRKGPLVISAEGIRAEESPARRKKLPLSLRKQITAKALREMEPAEALAAQGDGQRVAFNWYPLLDWKIDDVWRACGTSSEELAHRQDLYRKGKELEALEGWPAHPAYVIGNQRLSCALCVLASLNDLRNGSIHHRELFETYLQMEREGGFTFKNGWSLESLNGKGPEGPMIQGRLL